MSDQLIFDFFDQKHCDNFKESDFIISRQNQTAKKFLEKFFFQTANSENPINSVILTAESQAGKSHLLNIFAKKINATILSKSELAEINFSNFFVKNHFYIIENIDEIRNEELLFHILNSALENKPFLALSAKSLNNFHLKDLVSRLKNIPLITIEKPDEEFIKMLLIANLAKKQFRIKEEILDFLAKNLKCNYQAISDATRLIDFFANENKKDLTLLEAKKLFKDLII